MSTLASMHSTSMFPSFSIISSSSERLSGRDCELFWGGQRLGLSSSATSMVSLKDIVFWHLGWPAEDSRRLVLKSNRNRDFKYQPLMIIFNFYIWNVLKISFISISGILYTWLPLATTFSYFPDCNFKSITYLLAFNQSLRYIIIISK